MTEEKIKKPDNVRLAGIEDEEALFELLCELETENGMGGARSDEKVRAQIEKGTRRRGSIIGVIDGKKGRFGEDGGELAASVCLTLEQWWHSEEWYLAELWLFVRPDYRCNKMDRDLFQFAKWAQDATFGSSDKALPMMVSVVSHERLPAKLRLWSRHAKQIGGIFAIN